VSDQALPGMIDLRYGGRAGALSAWLSGETLIDCGPSACIDELLAGLGERRPRRLLLTHVHLDHAGAAGALVERWPELTVFAHPRGVPHLLDPARLVKSARRVFGERFDGLLGDVVAVPEANLSAIEDGQRIAGLLAAWTPGHAHHHVAFLEEERSWAYPGDVAGVRLAEGVVIPPTPPPDIDLDAWRASLEVLEAWRPNRLALAHFGVVEDPGAHLAQLREAIDRHERWAREGEEAFVRRLTEDLRGRLPASAAEAYAFTALARPSALGLRRWLERGQERPRVPAA
jgi:glyoxylase-like metal-dependent hydrolase (beta-lactamase superfamily II)